MSMWMILGMKSDDCFQEMVRNESTPASWMQGFDLFRDIVAEQTRKGGRPSMRQLAELAGDDCDLWDWMEDLLEELELFKSWDDLLQVTDFFLECLDWTDPEAGSDLENLRWKKANCLESMEDTSRTYELCSSWLEQEPDVPRVQEALARICLKSGRVDQTMQLCEQLLAPDPECDWETIGVYEMALQACLQAGDSERATELQARITEFQERDRQSPYADLELDDDGPDFLPF